MYGWSSSFPSWRSTFIKQRAGFICTIKNKIGVGRLRHPLLYIAQSFYLADELLHCFWKASTDKTRPSQSEARASADDIAHPSRTQLADHHQKHQAPLEKSKATALVDLHHGAAGKITVHLQISTNECTLGNSTSADLPQQVSKL